MKMTLGEVSRKMGGLTSVLSGNKKFPSKLRYAVAYNMEKLQKESGRIENERKRLCEQFAEKDEKGNPVMVKSIVNGKESQEYKLTEENRRLFEKEYNSLLDSEVDIEIRKVKASVVDECEKSDRYDIPGVRDMTAMIFMIEE